MPLDRAHCEALDRRDPLATERDAFVLPAGVIYLDGNSLGALPRSVAGHLARVVEGEWGQGLIRSWNEAHWITAPRRLGDKIAPLIGARPGEVAVADSTSVNLFKLTASALALRPGRRLIVTEAGNFPTDLYILEGAAKLLGRDHRVQAVAAEKIAAALGPEVALLVLSHVDYKSGRVHDLAAMTGAAQAAGALMLWDLSHSAGALPVDLAGAGADLAVGCGYKYLNGGPGAPAFLYVAERHQAQAPAILTGWMGHGAPFDFAPSYRPAPGIERQLCGTPPILAMAALEAALDLWAGIDMDQVRAKGMALTDLFIALVEERLGAAGFALASPREAERRGSQVSYHFAQGYPVVQALIARGVIGDFRAPDLMRFGFAPLYLRYADVWDAVERLGEIMAAESWRRPEFSRRAAVT